MVSLLLRNEHSQIYVKYIQEIYNIITIGNYMGSFIIQTLLISEKNVFLGKNN